MTATHFIGVLSDSMASLALAAAARGEMVSGSDDRVNPYLATRLADAGVRLHDMFAQANIGSQNTVVVGRYFDERHPEVAAATKLGAEVIGEIDYLTRTIGGTPVTTVLSAYEGPLVTTWIDYVLTQAGIPHRTFGVVTQDHDLPGEPAVALIALAGQKKDSKTFEADFLSFHPQSVVIPSVVYDFPDIALTLDDVYQSYFALAKRVGRSGYIIGNSDWSRMKRMRVHLADREITTYGFDRDALWRIDEVLTEPNGSSFALKRDRQILGPFFIPHVGFQALAAASAVVLYCLRHAVAADQIKAILRTLPPAHRYFEVTRDARGRVYIDDAADNPATIEDVLLLVRRLYPEKKVWCLYQGESFMRVKALASDYESVLRLADFVYIADIAGYPKEKSEGMHARHLVSRIKLNHPQTFYIESADATMSHLAQRIPIHDCVVTLGAYGISQQIVAQLKAEAGGEG